MNRFRLRNRGAFVVWVLVLSAVNGASLGQSGAYTDHTGRLDGPVAVIADRLIDAVNTNDSDAFLRFLSEYATTSFREMVPLEEHEEVFRDVCRNSGGLDYYGYRTYDPPRPANEHVVILKDRRVGAWQAFVLFMDEKEPDRIAGLQFAPARRPSNLPPLPPLSIEGLVGELDAHIDRLVAADAFSGTVLVAKDGHPLYERATGLASKRFGVANNMDTKFNLGSMNKMFTAVAIMKLVEEGRLSLDDPLGRFIDETWLDPAIASKIRVRHMLNHTSGLGSYFKDVFWESSRAKFRTLDDYKPLIRDETLAFEPGTDWAYSNTAMFLLGVVIEKVTGEDYFAHVSKRIFVPAGMYSTDSYEMDRPVPNLAIGYIPEYKDDGRIEWRNNLYMHVIKGGPAGGGFSTVRDLLRFDVAMRSGQLVSPKMRDLMWKPRPDENSPSYGYGFGIEMGPLGVVVGHGGGFPGLNGQLDMYLDAGYTVAVLSNYDGAATPVAQFAGALLARVK